MCLTRQCNTCHETKSLDANNFYPSKLHEGGYNTQCIKCNVAKVHKREKYIRESLPGFDPNSESEKARKATAREYYRKKAITDLLKQGLHHCSSCRKELPVGDFAKDKKAFSGLQSVCRACKKEVA
jgi:hypothetical protein